MKNGALFYCPKCGGKSLKQLSAKKFECERCTFTVYKNVVAAAAAIIEYDGKIIMTRRGKDPGKGKLDLPGGFVDEDESLEESLKREVKEDLGLRIYDLSYLCSFPNKYPYKGIEYSTLDSIFICKTDSIQIECEEGEIEHCEVFDPRKLNLNDVAFTSIRNALGQYLQSNGQ
jgi:NAD+ diphosphatase